MHNFTYMLTERQTDANTTHITHQRSLVRTFARRLQSPIMLIPSNHGNHNKKQSKETQNVLTFQSHFAPFPGSTGNESMRQVVLAFPQM